MTTFTLDQWLILTLAFALGLVLGMAALASPKWKSRYREEVTRHREEVTRREAVEADNERLRREAGEMDSLRHAAARDEARRRDPDVRDEAARRDLDVSEEARRRGPDERGPL
ncbi:MAG TPA: LapA family protein [Allosphingosinicella sp.]|nr:LapA family protein [Allosphingosinicella sp.]